MSSTPRVALVTGGGSGIGEAACRHLAAAGHAVAVTDIDGAAAEKVAESLRADGHQALALWMDVSDRSSVLDGFAKVRSELGAVAVLVTSAGISRVEPFLDVTQEVWERIFDVNVTGTVHCCQAALPDMLEAGWGRIITIASSSAQRGTPKMVAYAASKGAILSLTRSLAREYAKNGITVNTVPPSAILTPMMNQQVDQGLLPPLETMAKAVPMGHLGTPDDIAGAIAYLASDGAGFVTGQVLGVNGGGVM